MPALASLSRRWQFVRHVPPGKIARRVQLSLLRHLRDRAGARPLPATRATLRDDLPPPVMPPRHGGTVQVDGATMVLHFLGAESRFDLSNIDWSFASPVPSAQLWRMMLHYMEYLEAVDDASFALITHSWLAANGRIRPGAWRDAWNAYALSLRVVVLMQQLAARRATLDPALVTRIGESVAAQVRFLESNLETDIGGNHLIKNIKALLWAARAFDGPDAARWHRLGLRLLLRELRAQVLADGVHYERSPSYHAQVFADLLDCRAVLDNPLPELDAALARMAQATADLAHPDGLAAQFNDSGLHMAYDPATCLDVFAAQGGVRPQPQNCFAYTEAGYYGYRSARLTVIVDCGALAPDDLPAHGHGDMLSFELSLDGQRLIVDQGVYEYIPGPRRDAARSAASHNTLAVEGADQADFFDAFRFGRRGRITDCQWKEKYGRAGLSGAHDGYAALPGAPVHRRDFDIGPDGLILRDRLETTASAPAARIAFLLHPRAEVCKQPDGAWEVTGPESQGLRIVCSLPLQGEPAVWWPDMGREISTTRLIAYSAPGCTGVETRIEVLPAAAGPTN